MGQADKEQAECWGISLKIKKNDRSTIKQKQEILGRKENVAAITKNNQKNHDHNIMICESLTRVAL